MLIKAMLECGVQENLGITGYPPEMSVYLSLLSDTGIHRYVSGEWGLHPPKSDRNNISYTWSTIEAFLDDCEWSVSQSQNSINVWKNPRSV